MLEAACALVDQQTEQVLSARLDWIDGSGFEVAMIDEAEVGSSDAPSRARSSIPLASTAVRECLARAIALAGPTRKG